MNYGVIVLCGLFFVSIGGAQLLSSLSPCVSAKCSPGYECILVPVMCYVSPCPYKLFCVNEKCLQPAEPGMCKASIPSWFFNVSTGRCQKFIYGGCGGNSNRFRTEEECKKVCLGSIPK